MDAHKKMNEKDYIEQRVEEQLAWFEKKSGLNQARYKRLRLVAIVLSALIPLLVGFISDDLDWLKIATGAAGVLIAIAEGLLSLYKYQENWIQYRSTAEALKRESFFYKTSSGEYRKAKDPFPLFVERIEAIIEGDTRNWQQYISKDDSSSVV